MSCRTGPLRAGRALRALYIRFASLLPLVGTEFRADQREDCAKRITHHEVVAVRAGRSYAFCRRARTSSAWPSGLTLG
jgi:hypothetical protein